MDKENLGQMEKLADKVYDDALSPAMKEVGGIFSALAGFFNNVVAAPLHRLNAKHKIKTQKFIDNLYQEYLQIPEENRQEPPVNIVGPTLEALKYNIDEATLSELFANLLLAAMNNKIANKCHPAYVKILAQMDSTDALVLQHIAPRRGSAFGVVSPRCAIKIEFQGKTLHGYQILMDKFPDHYIGTVNNLSIFEISKSLYNLSRLGLINIQKNSSLRADIWDPYKGLINTQDILDIFNSADPNILSYCTLQYDKGHIEFTEFGKDFVECIIRNK